MHLIVLEVTRMPCIFFTRLRPLASQYRPCRDALASCCELHGGWVSRSVGLWWAFLLPRLLKHEFDMAKLHHHCHRKLHRLALPTDSHLRFQGSHHRGPHQLVDVVTFASYSIFVGVLSLFRLLTCAGQRLSIGRGPCIPTSVWLDRRHFREHPRPQLSFVVLLARLV